MQTPLALLKSVGAAVLGAVNATVLGDLTVEADAELAGKVWSVWAPEADEPHMLQEIQALARTTPEDTATAVTAVVEALAAKQPAEIRRPLHAYLIALPAAVRRALRRPSDPAGLTLPPALALGGPQDLLPLLPARVPWFAPGGHSWEGGDWELLELLEVGTFGEAWKARDTRTLEAPPVVLHFCLDAAGKQALRGGEGLLERVLIRADHPGFLRLQRAYLEAEPPCLQYESFEAGDLGALVREWHADPSGPASVTAAALVRQLAAALASMHSLEPPLVHRHLRPACVRVRGSATGDHVCKIAGLGVDELMPPRDRHAELYASPEQQRGEPPDPRDDVYALGVLWHQLLSGDLDAGRPGGSHWRRKLTEGGMASGLIDLLESCFEDDPSYRPADAAALAGRLAELLAPAGGTAPLRKASGLEHLLGGLRSAEAPRPAPQPIPVGAETPLRPGKRRSGVWDLLAPLEAPAQELVTLLTNSIGLKLALIQSGSFLMGSPESEKGRLTKEGPQHEVQLTNPFYLGVCPVTQQQYLRVTVGNPSRFHDKAGGGPEHPVENVTWEEAVSFCRRLSELAEEKAAGRVYRLPTEAEWEYACRAGTTTAFCCGDALGPAQANCDGNFPFGEAERGAWPQKTTRVGSYAANNFGLHDMHGNVWEWCADWHDGDGYRRGPRRNPQGPPAGVFRVVRGGSWRNHAATCRSAYRNGLGPRNRDRCTGFRVVLEVSGKGGGNRE